MYQKMDLMISRYNKKALCIEENSISRFAALFSAPGYGHDMIVASDDTLYIRASGFYPAYEVIPVKSDIIMISPSAKLSSAAQQVGYPNGLALINERRQMVVSGTFAAIIALFDVSIDSTLKNKRPFYWGFRHWHLFKIR